MEQKPNQYEQLWQDCKRYIATGFDLLRLELLDKLSRILGIIVLVIVALFIAFAAIAYFSVALVSLMMKAMSPAIACCILGVVLLIVLLILYLLREKIFINPFIKLLSNILFLPQQPAEAESEEVEIRKEVKDEKTV